VNTAVFINKNLTTLVFTAMMFHPLTQVEEIDFDCHVTYLDEHYQEPSPTECGFTVGLRAASPRDDHHAQYTPDSLCSLVGRAPRNESVIARHKLSPDQHVCFAISAMFGAPHTETRINFYLAQPVGLLRAEQVKAQLPFGESTMEEADHEWVFSVQMELSTEEVEETYPLEIFVRRQRQDFYIRRLVFTVPRLRLVEWARVATCVHRQSTSGISVVQ
jgi:hypothetical protein